MMPDMDLPQAIVNKMDLRKWFAQLPNLIDDSDLDPYEFRLLFHYYRVGNCFEGLATTASKTKMSTGKTSQARAALAAKGWIALEPYNTASGMGYRVTVVDKWDENFTYYSSRKGKPSLYEGSSLHGVRAKPSRDEGSPPLKPSPGEGKNIKTQEEQIQEEGAGGKAPRHPALTAYFRGTKLNPDKAAEAVIIETVGDKPENLKFWQEVASAYALRGWNKRNILTMLGYFKRHELPEGDSPKFEGGGKPNGNGNGNGKPAQDPAAIERAKDALAKKAQA